MNTIQLKYFIVLAGNLNYTTTSEQLFITQPTLSRNILSLEDELGTKLLSRIGNGVALTAAGQAFLDGILPLSQRFEELTDHVKAVGDGMTGEITLALSDEQQMPSVLSAGIRAFCEISPNVQFTFCRESAEGLRNSLLNGLIDLAVLMELPIAGGTSMEGLLLSEELPCIAVPAGDGLPHRITVEGCAELLNHRKLILPISRPSDSYNDNAVSLFQEMLHAPNIYPNVLFVKDSTAVSLYVSAGLGVTICNRSHFLALQPGIHLMEIQNVRPYRKVLQYRADTVNPAVQNFLKFFSAYQAQQMQSEASPTS